MSQVITALAITTTVALTGYSGTESPGIARWTGVEPVKGQTVACPVAWKGRLVCLEGYGCRLCEDTGAFDYLRVAGASSPHVDLYVGEDPAPATRLGVRVVRARVSAAPFPPSCFRPEPDYAAKWCRRSVPHD